MTRTERYKILSNIAAQKGLTGVDLHAELAKAENRINMMDTERELSPPVVSPVASPQPTTAPQMAEPLNTPPIQNG